ncbi:hypothetical protein NDU88_003249 [Pleurodeles waltl]|uniref:Uncharacterized protein n=1 Tax=Pleurodeles waltl TaxID=8319 RepID=A0AAV7UXY8_PLEWA|nr:hypothetical protein NDU88_003249 [Pleurodeles waltl]
MTTSDRILMGPGPLTLQDIMEAIQGVRTSLETRHDSVTTEVSLLRADMWNMATQVKELEESTASLQGVMKTLKIQVDEMQVLTNNLQARLEDYEGRLRKNNILIIGVPECAEGHAVDLFVENLIFKEL